MTPKLILAFLISLSLSANAQHSSVTQLYLVHKVSCIKKLAIVLVLIR